MTKKNPIADDFEGPVRYVAPALPSMPKLPKGLIVRILVDRGGEPLSAEDIAAAQAAFPLPAKVPARTKPSSAKPVRQGTAKKHAAAKPSPKRAR